MIRFDHVSKIFPDGTRAVDDVTFEVQEGECVTFVGPSGCGKTTTVKLLNRLVDPTQGIIYLNGEDTGKVDVIALRRSIGYVIQDVGLFPHMTVAQNISLVPRLIGWRTEDREKRTEELLTLVGLEPAAFGSRYPHQLSGGQRQRIGVARGLAADPPVILMDEPFGALDPITRAQLQDEFLRLRSRLKKTILFVTHDMDEAIKLGDRIAVMRSGRIIQFAPPTKILREPVDHFVKDLVGKESGLKLMKLAKVSDIMLPVSGQILERSSVVEARMLMQEKRKDVLLVVDDHGAFRGSIRFEQVDRKDGGEVADLMDRDIPTVRDNGEIRATLEMMLQGKRLWLPVVDEEKCLKGIVTMTHFAPFFASGA
ncbi:MAG: ATP-binding cassette domain-containing protein [Deltaproteobacteria bacterium]|nr:MAG: ATP-binding cassette domain-containing protein [Deltaproteobacteria bacterium]